MKTATIRTAIMSLVDAFQEQIEQQEADKKAGFKNIADELRQELETFADYWGLSRCVDCLQYDECSIDINDERTCEKCQQKFNLAIRLEREAESEDYKVL